MTGRFARWLADHPALAAELAGVPVASVRHDGGLIVLQADDGSTSTVAARGFDRRGPEPQDPVQAARPPGGADLAIALMPEAGTAGWGDIGAGRGATSWAALAERHPEARAFAEGEGLIFPSALPRLDDAGYAAGRDGLHRIAEVVSAARKGLTGRIGLRGAAGGFLTPGFPDDAWLQAGVRLGPGTPRLVVLPAPDDAGLPLEALSPHAAAAALAELFAERGAALRIDPDAFGDKPIPAPPEGFGTFLAFGANVLARTRAEAGPDASRVQLWPEHFDQAFDSRRVMCGIGPGEDADPEPYLYVLTEGPEGPLPDGAEWRTEPWSGAILRWSTLRERCATGDEAIVLARAFYAAGLATRAA